jgi:transposase
MEKCRIVEFTLQAEMRVRALVQTVSQQSFFCHVFLFLGRRGDILRPLTFEGDGLCLFAKRLDRGRFIWPQAKEEIVCLTTAQLSMPLENVDWSSPQRT